MEQRQKARMTHQWEQAAASMRELAAALGGYRSELILAGFDREEAMDLCLAFQADFMEQARKMPPLPPTELDHDEP